MLGKVESAYVNNTDSFIPPVILWPYYNSYSGFVQDSGLARGEIPF